MQINMWHFGKIVLRRHGRARRNPLKNIVLRHARDPRTPLLFCNNRTRNSGAGFTAFEGCENWANRKQSENSSQMPSSPFDDPTAFC